MSQLGRLVVLRSDPATQFTVASAQNAIEQESILAVGLSTKTRGRIVRAIMRATTNNIYDLVVFGTSAFNAAISAGNYFQGRVNFAIADGVQIAGAGPFLYDKATDIAVDTFDAVAAVPPVIYVGVVNRSAGALAGGANSLQVELWIDPTGGY
jgi:hypothetical protein